MESPNVFLLAADDTSRLLDVLQENPSLASSQDENGYSLLHAAASYNHLDLLRTLVTKYNVNVNVKDEDGETAIFVVETVECARLLVEELHADITIRGIDGKTALEKFTEENEFPEVAVYLRIKELEGQDEKKEARDLQDQELVTPPSLPEGFCVNIGTMIPEDAGEVVDFELKRKIEDLASRPDFEAESGQKALREIVKDALLISGERNTRPKID
ncbi:Ankyrin repeat-containing protein [Golovinomyces cichoracearum]|uniref:Ankyrin repeat-containing protein n=1 Tax=Golovinomyces cichoracearum TaxID=62708 RepID=A0A420J4L0_9PEZI|nr:Ankyrin repeat-containing protein [Golovinomyces cichoracearum]